MQAYKYKMPKTKNKPLVISIANQETKTNLVIGVLGPNRDSANQRNNFGERFAQTAKSLGIVYTYDGFDTAMFEIRSLDWKQFIEKLSEFN